MFLRNKNYEMMLIIQRYDYIFDMYIRFQNKTATLLPKPFFLGFMREKWYQIGFLKCY